MTMRRRVLIGAAIFCAALAGWGPALAQGGPARVLWWNANPDEGHFKVGAHREAMADYLDAFGGGGMFSVDYGVQGRGGQLAQALSGRGYDVVILDATDRRSRFDAADLESLKGHYAAGHSALMLDGTLNIRNLNHNETTAFPGVGGATAALLVNQVAGLAARGGGILIGTDHDMFQTAANAALSALVPGARFEGLTNPSTDGEFVGRALLGERVPVTPRDLLLHWQSIPNQGETPVGTFTDFLGRPVTFPALGEAADKPGGGAKRPSLSASFAPGGERTAIDSDALAFDDPPEEPAVPVPPPLPETMPTRKGGNT